MLRTLRHHSVVAVLALVVTLVQMPLIAQGKPVSATSPVGQLSIGDGTPVPVYSFSFGATNTVTFAGGGGAAGGRVKLSDISIIKLPDTLSAPLLRYVAAGVHLPRVKLEIFAKGSGNVVTTFDLTDAVVTSYQVNGGEVVESASFAFDRISMTTAGQTFCWDISGNLGC